MYKDLTARFDTFSTWFLGEKSLKFQTDWIIPILNFTFTVVAVKMLFSDKIDGTDFFKVVFSALASQLIVLFWEISFEISKDTKRERLDLCHYFIAWAIIIWQIDTILTSPKANFLPEEHRELLSSIFSSINSMFFLFSSADFDYPHNWQPRWKKWPIFKLFISRKKTSCIVFFVIVLDVLIHTFVPHSVPLDHIEKVFISPWFFDLFLSIITIFILGEGFIILFSDRFMAEQQSYKIKRKVLIFIIALIFFIVLLAQIKHAFDFSSLLPQIKDAFNLSDDQFKKYIIFINSISTIINQTYRAFVTLLFFTLQMSWVLKNRREVRKQNINLQKENKGLEEENLILVNEVSHRSKNHLLSLESGLSLQMIKPNVLTNSIAKSELSAALARIRTALSIHRLLDFSEDKNNVKLGDYIKELCQLHKELFLIADENFVEIVDSRLAQQLLPFAEARYIGLIITELLINVDQHAYAQGETKWVKIECGEMADWFYLRISDKGRGMPDNAEKGRGLSILDQIIKTQLYGSIEIFHFDESTKRGNVFLAKIPIKMLSFT